MYVLRVNCNVDDFASNLMFKLYKNIQNFYIGNFLLTGNFFVLLLHGEGFSCSFNIFLLRPFITFLKLGRDKPWHNNGWTIYGADAFLGNVYQ